jgi:NAD(P)-dependent dehydrogenase (short-subunit alcohol dehydrogenase family)
MQMVATEGGRLFITGNSSGLGQGITKAFLRRGGKVYGCCRRGCEVEGEQEDVRCDLSDFEAIPAALDVLLGRLDSLDLVILNAGVLGEIKPLHDTSVAELKQVFDINLFANKIILDWLHQWGKPVAQIIMISSGAAVLGSKGWGGYALSKASLNMLARLYAHEFQHTHITALAPGLIDTAMMDYLCETPDADEFPALARLKEARGTALMPEADQAGEQVLAVMPQLLGYPSGSFIDIRQIIDPEEYNRVFNK